MLNPESAKHNRNAQQELRGIDDAYVLDPSSGIYKPKTYYKEQQRKRVTKFLATWLPILISGLTLWLLYRAAIYARNTWRETKREADAAQCTFKEVEKQTILMHEQAVGTLAARIDPPQFSFTEEHGPAVKISCLNRGHVTGHISGEVAVIRKYRSGKEVVLENVPIVDEPIAAENETGQEFAREYPITGMKGGFTTPEIAQFKTDTPEQLLLVKGWISYENGFKDTTPKTDFCFSLLSSPTYTIDNATHNGGPSFAPCNLWQINRRQFLDSQKQSSPNTHP